MYLLLDTSTPVCDLTLVDEAGTFHAYTWQADRALARDLLGWLRDRLAEHGASWHDIAGIGVMQGPGSFTGLRIGMTVMNTLAHDRGVPIVGVQQADDWRQAALMRLLDGENDEIVLPHYGREANITKPRK